MGKWVPGVALIGLVCVMLMPAPGVVGILIGGTCALAIIVSVAMMLFERFMTRVVEPILRAIRPGRRSGRRLVHAGSGMARKA